MERHKTRKKMGIGYGIVLVLLAFVTAWAILGINDIVGNAGQVIDGNKLDGTLAQREVDHLNWVADVNTLLTDATVTQLNVETNDHKCGLGQWLYGDGRKAAETLVPSLAPLLKKMEAPHRRLHESAITIGKQFQQADPMLPSVLLARQIDHLNWAAKIRNSFLEHKDRLDVETDPDLCALGKWMNSEEGKKAYELGSPEFKEAWQKMAQVHKELHQSAILIGQTLKESEQSAQIVFKSETMPLLEKTLGNLNAMLAVAEGELKGMHAANSTYALTTMPA